MEHYQDRKYTLVDEGRSYTMSWDAMTTLMAHGMLRTDDEATYEFASEDEMQKDPGSAGVNYNKAGAVIAVMRAVLSVR